MNQDPNLRKPCLRRTSDLRKGELLTNRLESQARHLVGAALGRLARIPLEREWIQFQFYHCVLDDQRGIFERQLRFLRRHGDFIGLEQALAALRSGSRLGGRYFCLTFDDGFKNVFTNAVPILKELEIPAAFFIPTKYIGLDLEEDWGEVAAFYEHAWDSYPGVFEFLNWDECRQLATAGFTLGSHTHSHRRLTALTIDDAGRELTVSKQIIEERLDRPCLHFSCPWGKAGRDYDPAIHTRLARSVGYQSFLTAEAGPTFKGDSGFTLRRTACETDHSPAMLRYSLFSPLALRRGRSFDSPAAVPSQFDGCL